MTNSIAALLLRIGFGGLMLTHGWGKFMNLISGKTAFADPIGFGAYPTLILAVLSEFICPIFLIIGFKTKWMSILPAITMAVAAFIVHGPDPINKKELALLYLFVFVVLFLIGGGKYSLDWRLKKV